jgi:DNA-binding CsgD family transcriptional regulator
MLGIGISVFVSDAFLRELKTPPFFWIGPELAKRVARGDNSALLSQKQVQKANSRGGLNLLIWQGFVRAEDSRRADLWSELMGVFLDDHRGYLFKEIIAQGESAEHLQALRNTGGYIFGRTGCYVDFEEANFEQLLREPHIAGITRELALKQFGTWISSLFHYQPPQFGFSRSEQQLLHTALAGGTDQELSVELGISLSAVKKTWRSAYERVAACLPELMGSDFRLNGERSKRGRDKKQHLISYLREHPQELRPVSRKFLRQTVPSGSRLHTGNSAS